MKICYILPRYDRNTDTHFSYLYRFLEEVGKRADVFLIVESSASDDIAIPKMTHIYCQRFHFLPFRMIEGIVVFLIARLRGYRHCYIHYSFPAAIGASLIARISGGKTFYWNCGMPWLFGPQRMLRFVLRLVHILVTGTPRMAEQYQTHYGLTPEKVLVMPNWIDVRAFQAQVAEMSRDTLRKEHSLPPDATVLLFVHRLSRRKGADVLPDIMQKIRDTNTILLVAGDGPEYHRLQREIDEKGLSHRIRLLGRIRQRDIARYFAASDIFLMPSREEGFPHVLLESMAAGIPFVASDVGGIRDIVPDEMRDFVVSDYRPDLFAEKIEEIRALPTDRRDSMQDTMRKHVWQYDIMRAVDNFLNNFQIPSS